MKIKLGPASYIALATMVAGYVPLVIKLVEEGNVAVNQPEKWAAIGAFIGTAGLLLGRFAQAVAQIFAGNSSELAQLSAEARANAENVPPDEVDEK